MPSDFWDDLPSVEKFRQVSFRSFFNKECHSFSRFFTNLLLTWWFGPVWLNDKTEKIALLNHKYYLAQDISTTNSDIWNYDFYVVVLKDILLYIGLPQETTLQSLGLSLSGCEVEETNKELGEKLMKLHPKMVKEVPQVCSDTVGSLLTASEKAVIYPLYNK